MNEIWKFILAGILLIILIAGITFCACYFDAYFEAKAYERITGIKVITWDAMFVDLRVMEPARK